MVRTHVPRFFSIMLPDLIQVEAFTKTMRLGSKEVHNAISLHPIVTLLRLFTLGNGNNKLSVSYNIQMIRLNPDLRRENRADQSYSFRPWCDEKRS